MYKNVQELGHYICVMSAFCAKMYNESYFPIISS